MQNMEFTIDCKTWRFGGDINNYNENGGTYLLNSQGYMCCLGHCAINMGLKPEDILLNSVPTDVNSAKGKEAIAYKTVFAESHFGELTSDALYINDANHNDFDDEYTIENRMTDLIMLFNGHGHELEFINTEALV